jgi:YesN/AraC family two-component response regulator
MSQFKKKDFNPLSIDIKNERLLVVEDEKDLLDSILEVLKPITSDIITASNGREALELIKTQSPTAILSDINMPKMNGLELLSTIRHQLSLSTPFVVLTAFGNLENAQETLKLDATDFLNKPFDNEDLQTTIIRSLRYGVSLRQVEQEVDQLFSEFSIPNDKLNHLKKIKKATLAMRIENSIYVKTKAN